MIPEALTLADFTRCAGGTVTADMHDEILVPAATVDLDDLRRQIDAANTEVREIDNEATRIKTALDAATKRGQAAAVAKHGAALATATGRLEAAKSARADLETAYFAAGGEEW